MLLHFLSCVGNEATEAEMQPHQNVARQNARHFVDAIYQSIFLDS